MPVKWCVLDVGNVCIPLRAVPRTQLNRGGLQNAPFQLRKIRAYCKDHNGVLKVRCCRIGWVGLVFLSLFVCSVAATVKLPDVQLN